MGNFIWGFIKIFISLLGFYLYLYLSMGWMFRGYYVAYWASGYGKYADVLIEDLLVAINVLVVVKIVCVWL